jgi:hypothetical protein
MTAKAYKYRTIDLTCVDRDAKMYAANKFYASTFAVQNDLFEGNYDDQISETLEVIGPVFNVSTQKVSESLQKVFAFTERVGIFCLSRNATNQAMWANYGSSHEGYCIEYDLHKLKDTTSGNDYSQQLEIVYSNDERALKIEDFSTHSVVQKMFGTKGTQFREEGEVRLIFDSAGEKFHHPSAITGIYFGARAADALIERFNHLFAGREVAFYRIRPNKRHNQLEYELLFQLHQTLMYDIDKFDYRILAHRDNQAVENYDVYLKDEHAEDTLRNFILGFREKYCYKPSNINVFTSESVSNLTDKYPLSDEEYIRVADAFLSQMDFESDYLSMYPYKDAKYREILKKKNDSPHFCNH